VGRDITEETTNTSCGLSEIQTALSVRVPGCQKLQLTA